MREGLLVQHLCVAVFLYVHTNVESVWLLQHIKVVHIVYGENVHENINDSKEMWARKTVHVQQEQK